MIKLAITITDVHFMFLKSIETMLKFSKDIDIVSTYPDAKKTLKNLASTNPDVLLLDLNLPDGNGVDLCKILLKKLPNLRIIALTSFGETALVKNIIKNGAKGYILKNTAKNELKSAIRKVYNGEQYLQKSIQKKLLYESVGKTTHNGFIPKLTRREQEILNLISGEFTTNEIADKLFVSTKTVETHRSHIIRKLEVRNTAGLVRIAIEKGLLK